MRRRAIRRAPGAQFSGRGAHATAAHTLRSRHRCADDALRCLERGVENRKVASTEMNAESSRSHAVFTLSIRAKLTVDGVTTVRHSMFNLVDLAGSERVSKTGATGQNLKEGANINKSLSELGNVITSLVSVSEGKPRHVAYRNSKLTYLLKDSLGGNEDLHGRLRVAVEPETLSTLQFAQRAKRIKNRAVANEHLGVDGGPQEEIAGYARPARCPSGGGRSRPQLAARRGADRRRRQRQRHRHVRQPPAAPRCDR